jgi:hypothetical protein
MTGVNGLVEVVLVAEDIDRSMAFYRDTLGLEPISPPELPVKFLRIGPQGAGIPQQAVVDLQVRQFVKGRTVLALEQGVAWSMLASPS